MCIYSSNIKTSPVQFPCTYKESKIVSIQECMAMCKTHNTCDIFASMEDEAYDDESSL
jgi:hypothetical protein